MRARRETRGGFGGCGVQGGEQQEGDSRRGQGSAAPAEVSGSRCLVLPGFGTKISKRAVLGSVFPRDCSAGAIRAESAG